MAIEMVPEYPPIMWETGDTITAQKLNYVEQRINNLLDNSHYFLLKKVENEQSKYELNGRSKEELMKIAPNNIILGIPDQFDSEIRYIAYYIGEQPNALESGVPIQPTWASLSYAMSPGLCLYMMILTYEGNGIFTSLGSKEF